MSIWHNDQPANMAKERTKRMVVGLTTGLKSLTVVNFRLLMKPFAMRRALYRSTEPSTLSLIRKTHLQPITFRAREGGTKDHVLFLRRSLNSEVM